MLLSFLLSLKAFAAVSRADYDLQVFNRSNVITVHYELSDINKFMLM